MTHAPRLTPEKKALIVNLARTGMNRQSIAEHVGCAWMTVDATLRMAAQPAKPQAHPPLPGFEDVSRHVVEMCAAGKGWRAIARTIFGSEGASRRVKDLATKLGVKMAPMVRPQPAIVRSERFNYDMHPLPPLHPLAVAGVAGWGGLGGMRPEDRLQSHVSKFLKEHLLPPAIWTAIDKGVVYDGDKMKRIRTAQRMKARGLKNGIEDVQIVYGPRIRAIELKIGSSLSEDQIKRRKGLEDNGHFYTVCRSVIAVYEALVGDGVPLQPSARISALRHDAELALEIPPKPKRPSSRKMATAPETGALSRLRKAGFPV